MCLRLDSPNRSGRSLFFGMFFCVRVLRSRCCMLLAAAIGAWFLLLQGVVHSSCLHLCFAFAALCARGYRLLRQHMCCLVLLQGYCILFVLP